MPIMLCSASSAQIFDLYGSCKSSIRVYCSSINFLGKHFLCWHYDYPGIIGWSLDTSEMHSNEV